MNKLNILFLLLISTLSYCQGFIIPDNYELISEKFGDLDKDGIDEKVAIYNTSDTTEYGNIREIHILKKIDSNWVLWKKSRSAILKSGDGGMMGDPFENITIKNGILSIRFSGGSSWKWFYTDKYRFQNNEFELIGHSSMYGKPCYYWIDFDFNMTTGKIIYKKEFEDCDKDQEIYKNENENFYRKGIKVTLSNRNLEEIIIVSPKYKHKITCNSNF